MRLFDLLALILENLGRRKARVALTAIGVIIGTAAVVVLVSLAVGLQRSATQQLGGIGDLKEIQVYPGYSESMVGGGGGGPGSVVFEVAPGGQPPGVKLLTEGTLAELASLAHVVGIYPRDYLQGSAILSFGKLEGYPSIFGVEPGYLADGNFTLEGGVLEIGQGTVVVGELVAQGLYDPRPRPGQEAPTPPELLDQTIKLTLVKYTKEGTEARRAIQLKVVGVIAEARAESDYSIFLPLEQLEGFNQWLTGRRVNRQRDGYPQITVRVDEIGNVLDATEQIVALGYQATTPQEIVQGINSFFLILQAIFGGVGAISLLVAAIGIANTMTTAILERTREIGLMKAVGATNREVLAVFLGEAGGIGLLGGIGGVALGWSAGQVINVLVVAYLAGQAAQTGQPPPSAAVYTPLWLPIFALLFAAIVGLLSGLYPALRAATLVPVTALKYE